MKRNNETAKIRRDFKLEHWHVIAGLLVLYDIIATNGAYLLALWLRFDCQASAILEEYFMAWAYFTPIYGIVCVLVFHCAHLYRSMWRFASYDELVRVFMASVSTSVFHVVAITLLFRRMPISYYLLGAGFQFLLVLGVRFSYRFILWERRKRLRTAQNHSEDRVMLVGAGNAGQLILRDIHNAKELKESVVCIIDDNPNKWGRYMDGVPIVGGRHDILEYVKAYNVRKIYLAIPSAKPSELRDIIEICKDTGCEIKNLPGMYQFVTGQVQVSALRNVEIEDLLGRDSVKVEMEEIFQFLSGKVILVTGGGGSIGSELCRQIAKNNPKKLVILDIYENNAHAIALELRDKYPDLNLDVLIGSVRDSRRVNQVFEKYRPEVVYHAAAHKHVPLMEDSPCESIKNNVIGTYKTAYAAMMNGCKRFVLISTDKAVNPTNIMGASKRLCEMVIQCFDYKVRSGKAFEMSPLFAHHEDPDGNMHGMEKKIPYPQTDFVAVRFGNVLGSNGSVVPRFREQIAKGGPVTVTHPDIIRYFMTIPEAASLVLQAGTYAEGGEIFVLDMGSPVKIDTLARNLIKLSGLKPDEDIEIRYTGLRSGEKLYEEKLMAEEGLRTTPNHLIHIGCPIPFDMDAFVPRLQQLMNVAYDGREDDIRDLMSKVVTTYHPAGDHGSEAKGAAYERQMASAIN